jgi:tetratricopeptide (TPR) repeat protein
MTTGSGLKGLLATAIGLRETGRDEEARALLIDLADRFPEDAQVSLQCAWIHDKLGLETEAVSFYEKALALGLADEALRHALLGLGSTYRALGRYQEARVTLDRGVAEFPDDRGMRVFRALATYNLGQAKEACSELLTVLVETTGDESITRYRAALGEYAADLDRTWA